MSKNEEVSAIKVKFVDQPTTVTISVVTGLVQRFVTLFDPIEALAGGWPDHDALFAACSGRVATAANEYETATNAKIILNPCPIA